MAHQHIDGALYPQPEWAPFTLNSDGGASMSDYVAKEPSLSFHRPWQSPKTTPGQEGQHGIQRTGLDPFNRPSTLVPNLKDLEADREAHERTVYISDWLSHDDKTLSGPREDPADRIAAIDRPGQDPGDDIAVGGNTENQFKSGQTFFIEKNDGQMVEEDYRIILASRNWDDAPVLSSISKAGADRHQPPSSQAAIERFARLNRDSDSVVSRAATWGTRRRSLPSVTDLDLEEVSSGNILRKLSLNSKSDEKSSRSSSFFKELRDIIKPGMTSRQIRYRLGKKHSKTEGSERSPHSTWSSNEWPSVSSEESHPHLVGMLAKSGGPPILNLSQLSSRAQDVQEDNDGIQEDAYVKMESHFVDGITPSLVGFQEHILHLNPALAHANQFLVERISRQQVTRYQNLLNAKARHKVAGANCSSGPLCAALGGSAKRLERRDVPGWCSPATTLVGKSDDDDDDDDTLVEGTIGQDIFPPGIPKPPTDYFPAELECQLCFTKKKLLKPSDWTKHVHEDIQPFTCTWEKCKEPKMFKRKADWVRHENEGHRRLEWWKCDLEDCNHICVRVDNFLQHLVREHKFPEPRIWTKAAIKRASNAQDRTLQKIASCHQKSTARPEEEPCRFCGRQFPTWKKLTVHLAKHMEQISLPVIRLAYANTKTLEADTVKSPVVEYSLMPHNIYTSRLPHNVNSSLMSWSNQPSSALAMFKRGSKRESWDSGYNMSATSITSSEDAVRSLDQSIGAFSSKSPFRVTGMLTPFSEMASATSSPHLARLKEEDLQGGDYSKRGQHGRRDEYDNHLLGNPKGDHPILPTGFLEHIQELNHYMRDANRPLAIRLANLMIQRYYDLVATRSVHLLSVQFAGCSSGELCSGGGPHVRWRSLHDAEKRGAAGLKDLIPTYLNAEKRGAAGLKDLIPTCLNVMTGKPDFSLPMAVRAALPVELECPICFKLVTLKTLHDWSTHIYADLKPYVCTLRDCRTEQPSFATKEEWMEHENKTCVFHYGWPCSVHTQRYRSRDAFIEHLAEQHGHPMAGTAHDFDTNTGKVDERLGSTFPLAQSSEVCCFCGCNFPSLDELHAHHATHMEQISLPILDLLRSERERDPPLTSKISKINETQDWARPQILGRDVREPPKRPMMRTRSPNKHDLQGYSPISPSDGPAPDLGDKLGGLSENFEPTDPFPQLEWTSVFDNPGAKEREVATETLTDATVSSGIKQEDAQRNVTVPMQREPTLKGSHLQQVSAPETVQCADPQALDVPKEPEQAEADAEMAKRGQKDGTPTTDTNSVPEDAVPHGGWNPTRLRQVGIAQIRIERIMLSKSLHAIDSSDEDEWYDEEEGEELEDNSTSNENNDQSGDDQQNSGSSDRSIQKEGEQSGNKTTSQPNKRKRQDGGGIGGADEDGDGDHPDSAMNPSKSSCIEDKKRWACPFQVHEEQLNCLRRMPRNQKGGCGSINHLKQHLNRKHRRSFRCERCWRSFDTKQHVVDHGAQQYPCEPKAISINERFMSAEAEDEIDKCPRMSSNADMWYHLFRSIIPGMMAWETLAIRQRYSPYYVHKDPVMVVPSINFAASAFQHAEEAASAVGEQSPDNFGDPSMSGTILSSQSVTMPLLAHDGTGLFNLDPYFSFNPIPSDSTPSEVSMLGSSLMSKVPSSAMFSASSTGMPAIEPPLCDAQLRRNYERLKARNQQLQDESTKSATDVVQIEALLEDLLEAGGLNDLVYSKVAEISSQLGQLKKRLG